MFLFLELCTVIEIIIIDGYLSTVCLMKRGALDSSQPLLRELTFGKSGRMYILK